MRHTAGPYIRDPTAAVEQPALSNPAYVGLRIDWRGRGTGLRYLPGEPRHMVEKSPSSQRRKVWLGAAVIHFQQKVGKGENASAPTPTLEMGDVVILDNLALHKERGAWFLFLAPRSPDLNPIEKASLQTQSSSAPPPPKEPPTAYAAPSASIRSLFNEINCWNYFKAVGYASD